MKNPEEEIFIDLSLFGSSNYPNHRIINFFLASLIIVGLTIFFTTLFYRPYLFKDGIVFLLFSIISSTWLWYWTSHMIIKLQISSHGVIIQTLITNHHYSASDIKELLLRENFLSWLVFRVTEISTNRNTKYYLINRNTGEMAPMYYDAKLKDAIENFNNYLLNGRLTSASS